VNEWIVRNWPIKLTSIGLAALFWILLVGEQELATSITVPVQYRNVPKDLETISDVSEKVNLEIRGPSGKIAPANLADTAVVLDLATVTKPGERTFPIGPSVISLPYGVALDRAVPSQVRLHFERRVSKEVGVKVRIGKQPSEGYAVVSVEPDPAMVRIVGPESRVQDETGVESDPVDLSDVTESAQVTVHAFVGDPQVRIAGDGKVTLKVTVRKQ
jgi:YbbR domain-containing protein